MLINISAVFISVNPPTRVGVHSNVYYVASKTWFKIQNPKSEIQNPKSEIQNPKSEIQNPKFAQKEMLHNAPKSKIRTPKSKSQNPKSKIQNLGRWGPHIKNCYITIQNPKSKIPKIRPKKFGFWILDWGILDFGFQILDFGFRILDFGGVQGMYH